MTRPVIPIRLHGGMECCDSCINRGDMDTCEDCDEADLYEEDEEQDQLETA